MELFLDLETTGLPQTRPRSESGPRFYNYREISRYDSARIVQVGVIWQTKLYSWIIKRDGFNIDNHHIHHITDEISDSGVPIKKVFEELEPMIRGCTVVVAHNIEFDINVLKSELYRYSKTDLLECLETKPTICTMVNTMNLVKARNQYGIKFPRLSELYFFLFGRELQNAHSAPDDTQALYECYLELVQTKYCENK